jgi:hypothetical protein
MERGPAKAQIPNMGDANAPRLRFDSARAFFPN